MIFQPEQIVQLVRQVGREVALPYFHNLDPRDIHAKSSPTDVATIADIESEKCITPVLRQIVPGSLVVGEEATGLGPVPNVVAMSYEHPVWSVDPVDGTSDFVNGIPNWSNMISLTHKGEGLWACIYYPVADVAIVAEKGSGAFMGERRLSMLDPPDNERVSGLVVAPKRVDEIKPFRDRHADLFQKLSHSANAGIQYTRLVTSFQPAPDKKLLAQRAFFLRFFGGVTFKPWDHLPGQIIARESGALVKTFTGNEINLDGLKENILIAAPKLWTRLHRNLQNDRLFEPRLT